MALDLPNWNEALSLEPEWEQAPLASHPTSKAQLAACSHGVGRVKTGVQGTVGAAQHKLQTEETAGMRAEGLGDLPNALSAEYWLKKAAAEEQAGRPEAALVVLKEALERDVRPVTDVLRAMEDLNKRTQPQEGPLDVTGSVMADVGNRVATGRFTPSKTGLTGKATRVPSRFARTPGVATAAAEQGAGTAAGAAAAPKTTLASVLKRLTFSAAKPGLAAGAGHADASATPRPAGAKQRHVSFGAGTVSPAARPAARQQSHVQFLTPQPTIDENESESPAPSQVNSVNAGRTPYDARLSGLLRKYSLPDMPAVPLDEDQEQRSGAEDLVAKSPCWRALSASVSVSDSIKGLSKKYSSDVESMPGLSSPELSPLATTPLGRPSEAKSQQSEGASPAMDPTPHHLLDGWQRNALYESPSQGAGAAAGQAAAAPAAVEQPAAAAASVQEEAENQLQARGAAQAGASSLAPLLAGEVSPFSGAVHLAAAPPAHFSHAEPEGSPATEAATPMSMADSDLGLTPLTLSRRPAEDEELDTAGTPSTYFDGVPRDASGIPLVTPATVTVARGGQQDPQPFRDDGLAANLFESFDSPQLSGGDGFSFVPNPSQSSSDQDGEGDTPSMQSRASSEDMAASPGTIASQPSPEILGYQEQCEVAASASAQEPQLAMPRSILKAHPVPADGTPLLGRAQRVPSPTKLPRGTAIKELRALMSDLSVEDREMQSLGTLAMLSPVRTHGHLRAQLGVDKVVTPVRRSVRNQAPHAALPTMLEQTNFSYVPNEALLGEEAAAKQKPKTAKKHASKGETGVQEAEARDQEQAVPNTEAGRQQSTRKSRLHAGSSAGEAPAVESAQPAGRRYNTRLSSVHTPLTVRRTEAEDAEVFTPPASALGPRRTDGQDADTLALAPVPQDGSPALTESPALASATAAIPATLQERSARCKSTRHTTPAVATTPVAPALAAAAGEEPATQRTTRRRTSMAAAAVADAPHIVSLSPTEVQIRSALRRSARKSTIMRGG